MLVLLLGLLVSAVAVENLKKFPILMPNVKPERVSIRPRVLGKTSSIGDGGCLLSCYLCY